MSSPTPQSAPSTTSQHTRCQDFVKEIFENVNTVKYLVDSIKKISNREISLNEIKCLPSAKVTISSSLSSSNNNSQQQQQQQIHHPPVQQAGYMWSNSKFAQKGEIILLEDLLREKDDVERALRHELVHAFDDARGEIEPTNCYHQACSEVRAARLSGDCFIGEELKRGRVGTVSGRDCVIRRATLAVENSPLCRSFGARSVEVVMPRCYRDFEPFIAPPYVMGNATGSAQ